MTVTSPRMIADGDRELAPPAAVSDDQLRLIAEQGFFGCAHTLADARSACAELIFARSVIEAQTAKIKELAAG